MVRVVALGVAFVVALVARFVVVVTLVARRTVVVTAFPLGRVTGGMA